MMEKVLSLAILIAVFCNGCQTVYNAQNAPADDLANEGSIVFVRPDRYTILGTRSIRDYIEITYEELSSNEAGYPKVQVGLRNRGGQHIWDTKGPEVVLSVKTVFYANPIAGTGPTGPPVYETNWQSVHLNRGETEHFKVVCPKDEGRYYQMTISELIK